jgi:enoyl-CoA hydratase/carnithine racemase
MRTIVLNRPQVVNTLTREMVRLIGRDLTDAWADQDVQFFLLTGAGDRGFCAGGDLKALAAAVGGGNFAAAEEFLREEYEVDLLVHRFPKPVIVLGDGITMGGGLGLAAGADIVVATERTRMAMPETRIGFFPDVGATGWLFTKCPPGYPEYLGLTGYELQGAQGVRLGLAEASPFIRALLTVGPVLGVGFSKAIALGLGAYCVWRKKPHVIAWINYWYAGLIVWNLFIVFRALPGFGN